MKIDEMFNVRRFLLLCRSDFYFNIKPLLISAGAIGSILFMVTFFSAHSSRLWPIHVIFYPLTLFIGGFFFTSIGFREIHNRDTSYSYLTLPVSNLERFFCKFLMTTLGYVVLSLLFYFCITALASVISSFVFTKTHALFSPNNNIIWLLIRIYIVTHSVIFFGSVYFKSLHLFKTLLALFILAISLKIVLALSFRIIYFDYFTGLFFPAPGMNINFDFLEMSLFDIKSTAEHIIKFVFWFTIAPFFWGLTYLRLKEKMV
jgi:hypothetical protein